MKKYDIVCCTNYLNHYSLALKKELDKYFIKCTIIVGEKLPEDRQKLGFSDLNNEKDVIKAYEDNALAKETILKADVVITGSYKYESHINERLKANKLVFFDSERLFKYNGILNALSALRNIVRYRNSKNAFLLCISAFTANDYEKLRLFNNRKLKWGYFPETKEYDKVEEIINNKKRNSIFWAGRLIGWKHPEYAIYVAKKLKEEGIEFSLKIAGTGEMEEDLKKMVSQSELNKCVEFLGSMPPEMIRKHMEESEIYLFTSDKGEGWGVVLNEAMNSCCVPVASFSAGSTPFLIKDGENGFVYKNDSLQDLYVLVKKVLCTNKQTIMKASYDSIQLEWNCNQASKRIYHFVDEYISKNNVTFYESGILSESVPTL